MGSLCLADPVSQRMAEVVDWRSITAAVSARVLNHARELVSQIQTIIEQEAAAHGVLIWLSTKFEARIKERRADVAERRHLQGGKLAAQYDAQAKERTLDFKPEWEKLEEEKKAI